MPTAWQLGILFVFMSVGSLFASPASALGGGRQVPDPEPPVYRPDPDVPDHGSFILRIMTYNVASIPFPRLKNGQNLPEIGRLIALRRAQGNAPHIVAFQETFTLKSFNMIQICKYPYIRLGPPSRGARNSSGLAILSEFPFLRTSSIVFSNCGGVDCMARKGALHARVRVPQLPFPVDVVNTHVNSSYNHVYPLAKDGTPIRIRQFKQLHELTARIPSFGEQPWFFVGDFNTSHDTAEYQYLVEGLAPAQNAVEGCAFSLPCTGEPYDRLAKYWRTSVDHQLYHDTNFGESERFRVTPVHIDTTFFERSLARGRLSDHYALEVHYLIEW